MGDDPRADDKLADEPFSYRASGDGKVFISWQGRTVMTLKDRENVLINLLRLGSGPDDPGSEIPPRTVN